MKNEAPFQEMSPRKKIQISKTVNNICESLKESNKIICNLHLF